MSFNTLHITAAANAAKWTADMHQRHAAQQRQIQINAHQHLQANFALAEINGQMAAIHKDYKNQIAQIQAQADSIFATEGAKVQALAATNKQLVDQANALSGQLNAIADKCKQLYEAYEQKETSIENLQAAGIKLIADIQKNEAEAKEIRVQILEMRDSTAGITAEIDELSRGILKSRRREEKMHEMCDHLVREIAQLKTLMNNETEREKKIVELSEENTLLSQMASQIMMILQNSETI